MGGACHCRSLPPFPVPSCRHVPNPGCIRSWGALPNLCEPARFPFPPLAHFIRCAAGRRGGIQVDSPAGSPSRRSTDPASMLPGLAVTRGTLPATTVIQTHRMKSRRQARGIIALSISPPLLLMPSIGICYIAKSLARAFAATKVLSDEWHIAFLSGGLLRWLVHSSAPLPWPPDGDVRSEKPGISHGAKKEEEEPRGSSYHRAPMGRWRA